MVPFLFRLRTQSETSNIEIDDAVVLVTAQTYPYADRKLIPDIPEVDFRQTRS